MHLKTRRTEGMAVLVVIVLLAVMCAFVITAAQSLTHLKSELKEIERDQTNRLATSVKMRSP